RHPSDELLGGGRGLASAFLSTLRVREDRRGQVGRGTPPTRSPGTDRAPSLTYHPPIIPRGRALRRTQRPGIEGRESGLSGNPDIPDPPNEGPTDLRGRLTRGREAVRALISTLPRVLGLVWSASRIL